MELFIISLILSCTSVTANAVYKNGGQGVADCSDCHNNAKIDSSDPCVNHLILNDPWRSTIGIENGNLPIHCDDDKHGWYRFVGSGGVLMSETCLPPGRCQTQTPLWLNGRHPAISDGIVDRTVCGNMGASCCQFTNTIQIKACPGGYHVYNLNRIQSANCFFAYCTDPFTEVCKADSEWKLGDKGYGCYCKDEYKVSTLSDIRPQLTCGLREMKVSFQKCQMKDLDIWFDHESIKDNRCFNYDNDNSKNTFSVFIPLKSSGCRVQSSQKGNKVTYSSTLVIEVNTGDIITRYETLTYSLSCSYTLDMMTSLGQALHPILSSINITIGGVGQFRATMALYKDREYTTPYEGTEVPLALSTILYIGVFIEGGDTSQYVLVMRDCYATPTNSILDMKKYYIIQDSCPNKEDKTINVYKNGVSREGQVSVQMFRFIGDYNRVYLHCAVSLCDTKTGVCTPLCPFRSDQRIGVMSQSPTLMIGPIVRSGSADSSVVKGFWVLLVPALLLLQSVSSTD